MSGDVIGGCFGSPPPAFDPEHFLNWWSSNAANISSRADALEAYRNDLAGQKFQEPITAVEKIYEQWLEDAPADEVPFTRSAEKYSEDTQRLLKILHNKVFSRDSNVPAEPARILAAGDVQSGKTGAYTELIKALLNARNVAGFPGRYIILVLAGVHNKLRLQTQERLSLELASHEAAGDMVWLTSKESDLVAAKAIQAISGASSASYVAVVKKETSRLNAAAEVFEKLPDGNSFAVIIIDDECDQITPDTKKKEKPNSRRVATLLWGRTKINDSWSMVDKFINNGLVYIGYTATPYSNVFLDLDRARSMYPSTYMYVLTPGEGYMGYDHYWPPSETAQQTVDVFEAPDGEICERRRGPDKFKVSGTALEESLIWFLVAACIKRERLASGRINPSDRHTSMLVHAHVKVADHVSMRDAIEKHYRGLANELKIGGEPAVISKLLGVFKKATGTEGSPVSKCGEDAATVELLLQKHLAQVLENMEVVCDNSRSTKRLSYPDDREPGAQGKIVEVVAVGGYTLSRGITLRGLVSSYVSRITKVVYDTYLQLCRWFGYRRGYEDLTRLWISGEVSNTYADIAAVDRQFKKAITTAGLDPNGPYGHEQIYLDAVAGALPSSNLDSLIRSTAFKGGKPYIPYGNRLFGPSQAWADTDVDSLSAPNHTGKDVADFLEKYTGPDRNRIVQLVNFIRENKELHERGWDVSKPIKGKDSAARFERSSTTPLGADVPDVWYVKTPDDKAWRKVKDRPLLVIAPALILPPAEVSGVSPRPDWIVTALFDKNYGTAEAYMNESIQLLEGQQEEFAEEDVKGGRT